MDKAARKKKMKIVNRIAVAYFSIMSLCLVAPPITRLFDRNDVWVGFMPLSQFYILFFTGMIVLGLAVLYWIDTKMEGGGKK